MEEIEVLVKAQDRNGPPGCYRWVTVPVSVVCFNPENPCWKTIACIKAAAILEQQFTWLLDHAKYGFKPAQLEQLKQMYQKTE